MRRITFTPEKLWDVSKMAPVENTKGESFGFDVVWSEKAQAWEAATPQDAAVISSLTHGNALCVRTQ